MLKYLFLLFELLPVIIILFFIGNFVVLGIKTSNFSKKINMISIFIYLIFSVSYAY